MNKIEDLRNQMSELSNEIAALLHHRGRLAVEIIEEKTGDGRPVADLGREREFSESYGDIWREILPVVRTRVGASIPRRCLSQEPAIKTSRPFAVIAGPCSIDEDFAGTLLGIKKHVDWIRCGIFKPRTVASTWQGGSTQDLVEVAALVHHYGKSFVTEIVDPDDIEDFREAKVDCYQVGARNGQNYELLRALNQARVPVLLKRAPGATVEEWLGAASYLPDVPLTLCERGVKSFERSTRNMLDLAGAILAQRLSGLQVIVDPSHATGIAGLVPPLTCAAHAAGLDGAMIEVHANPEASRTDSAQQLDVETFAEMFATTGAAKTVSET